MTDPELKKKQKFANSRARSKQDKKRAMNGQSGPVTVRKATAEDYERFGMEPPKNLR